MSFACIIFYGTFEYQIIHIELSNFVLNFNFSSYQAAVKCVRKLHDQCPAEKHNEIRVALVSLENTQTEPSQLCKDDNMFDGKG